MASLGTLSVDIGARTNKFTSALNTAQARAASFGKSVTSALSRLGSVGGEMGQLLGVASIGAAAAGVLKLAAGAEQTAMEFEVLTGSAENAQAMLQQLRDIDMKTVFGTQDLAKAAGLMMRMGMSSDQVVPIIGMMTEVAGSSTEKLQDLAYAMSQVQMAGRLTGQENLQLINAGFSPLAIIAEQTGRSMSDLKKDMEAGAISVDMVKQALSDLTTGSGRLAGFQNKVAQSTAGMFAKAQTNLELLAIEIGGKVLPYANQFLQWAISAMQSMDGLGETFGTMLSAAGEWFTSTSDYFADMGVIVGTVVGNMDLLFEGLFTDLPNYAQAALEWVAQNTQVMFSNIATGAQNMWAKLEQGSQQLGEEIAFALGMSDEVLQIPDPVMQQMQEFQGFQGPEFSAATQNLAASIQEQLKVAREMRQAATEAVQAPAAPANTLEKVLAGIGAAPPGAAGAGDSTGQAQQRTDFAQAAMRGSTEAYSIIANAMRGEQSPVVKATKEQTKVLQHEMKNVAQAVGSAPRVSIVGAFEE
jgi:tape measure domain-containing protein